MLFQPSNIYPSTFSGIGAGTVDVTQGLNVSWQVNGDTPMTAYQIKIYQNDTDSTLMYDSGKQTVTPAFEPHDRFGNPTFFNTLISAASMSSAGIVNGYQYGYKMLITQWWDTNDYVEQTSASVFITRSTPTLVIDAIPNPVATNSITITATYTQDEGDPISTVEWVFAQAGSESTPIKETGAISTQVLSFDADGLITGNTYSIMCNIVTSNGMEASTGFVQFNVSYPSITGDIGCQVAQMKNSSAVYLSWNQIGGNVLKYPYTDDTKTVNGITFTVNGEGDISVSGTASDDATFDLESGTLSQLRLTPGEKLLITVKNDNFYILVTETDGYGNVTSTIKGTSPLQYIVPDTQNTLTFSVLVGKGSVLSTETIQPMMYIEYDIVSLDDLYVTMSPIQDLHGYDSPWPAGGGVNLLDISIATPLGDSYGLTKSIDSDGYVHLDGTITYDYNPMNIAVIKAGESQIEELTGKGYIITMTDVSGCTITATWGLRDIDNGAIACSVANPGIGVEMHAKFRVVVATTSVTAFSPYENLCPITGRTSASAWRNGVNQWDEETESGYINTSTGEKVPDSSKIRMKNPICVKPDTTYYYSTPTAFYICCYDAGMNFIGRVGGSKNTTFTTPSDCAYIQAGFESAYGTTYNHDISINYPSTDTDYHAYNGTLYSVEFPALGANQWDEEWELGDVNNTTGQFVSADDRIRCKNYIPVIPSKSYYFHEGSSVNFRVFKYGINKSYIGYVDVTPNTVFTTDSDTYYLRFRMFAAYGTTYNHDISINYPATVTAYEPYTNTVYSGTLEIVGGVLTLTMVNSDLGSFVWDYNSNDKFFYRYFSGIKPVPTNDDKANMLCEIYETRALWGDGFATDDCVIAETSAGQIRIRDSRFTNVTLFKTAMSGVHLCYELAEPLVFQLTPQQVMSLVGQNVVWSEDGPVTLTYETNMGRKETLSGDIVSFNNSKAVPIPEPEFRPGVLGVEVYRYSQDDPILRRVYSFTGDTSSLLDYYAPSQKPVSYLFVAHGSEEDVFVVTDQFKPTFWFYSILLCSQDSNGNYHVEKEYVFRYGVESGNVSNNNEPTIQRNFTPYPNRQPVSSLYKTGKVTGYIGTVSGAKVYSDSVALQNAIYAISTSPLTKFLKTRKGDVLMIDTASSIQMKTDDKTVEQALKATVDWVEMGDTEGLSIVSIPTDSFWPID